MSNETSEESAIPWHLGIHDAHCHPTDTMATTSAIPSMKAAGLTIMGTRFEDQSRVAQVARTTEKVVPSFGYHPWFSYLFYDDRNPELASAEPQQLKKLHYTRVLNPEPSQEFMDMLPVPTKLSEKLDEIRDRLKEFPEALVGEIGMDRGFRLPELDEATEGPNATPVRREGQRLSDHRVAIDHQRLVFESQLRIAGEFGRAVSVHGVACHGVVFDTFRELWKGHEKKVERNRDKRRRRRKKQGEDGGYEYLPDMGDSDSDEASEAGNASEAWTPKPYPPRICLHSFSAPFQQLEQWLKRPTPTTVYPSELYFSFSTTINANPTRGHLNKIEEIIKRVPDEAVLVESDLHTAGPRQDEALGQAVQYVCKIRGWELEDGVKQLGANWKRYVYGKN